MAQPQKGFADLSAPKRAQCAHFLTYYADEERSVSLTLLLEKGTGENSFKRISEKLYLLSNDKDAMLRYYEALYKVFTLQTTYKIAEIIGLVSRVRRELGYPPYTSGLLAYCLRDFYKLFIVEIETNTVPYLKKDGTPATKTVKVGYKPLFRLKQ